MWSELGLETRYHYLFDLYNMDKQRILAWSNQQNKMELIYETTDKQHCYSLMINNEGILKVNAAS